MARSNELVGRTHLNAASSSSFSNSRPSSALGGLSLSFAMISAARSFTSALLSLQISLIQLATFHSLARSLFSKSSLRSSKMVSLMASSARSAFVMFATSSDLRILPTGAIALNLTVPPPPSLSCRRHQWKPSPNRAIP